MAANPIRTINWGMRRDWKRIPILKFQLRKMAEIENAAAWHKKIQRASVCSKVETQNLCVKH